MTVKTRPGPMDIRFFSRGKALPASASARWKRALALSLRGVMTLLFAALFLSGDAWAKVYIDLAAPSIKKIPIAVEDFRVQGASSPEAEAAGRELMDALKADLNFSGLFTVIDKAAHLEDPASSGITEDRIDFKLWRTSGADVLIKGGFSLENNRLVLEARFFDCVEEKLVTGKKYIGSASNPRRIIHYFSDHLYEELTGRKGIFTSRIMFVSDRTGAKEVYIADYDGKNATQITRNRSINLSPQWSPDGKKILYTSYKKGSPLLYMLDLRNGSDEVASDKPGLNIGARFSPDGGRLALTLSVDKSSPELYILELASKEYKRVTTNFGIDVSPAWSPDGKRLAFVSDTAGNPHIFMLDLATGNQKRITFNGKYNSSPAWSPDGRKIAFSRSDTGRFNIWVMAPDGGSMTQLTFEKDNRAPSWSPDGRFIVFSSTVKGNSSLYIMQADGTGLRRLETGIGNEKTPVWSPYLQ